MSENRFNVVIYYRYTRDSANRNANCNVLVWWAMLVVLIQMM